LGMTCQNFFRCVAARASKELAPKSAQSAEVFGNRIDGCPGAKRLCEHHPFRAGRHVF
jgi:hypothetical protein